MKQKNYKARATTYSAVGYSLFGLTTASGFLLYESFTDFDKVKQAFQNFTVFQEGSYKLNPVLTISFLFVIGVILFVVLKKNKSFFKNKASLGLIIATGIFYLLYCTITLTLFTLAGASVGCMLNEFIFSPLAKKNKEMYLQNKDISLEYEKEKQRIRAREEIGIENNGNV